MITKVEVAVLFKIEIEESQPDPPTTALFDITDFLKTKLPNHIAISSITVKEKSK